MRGTLLAAYHTSRPTPHRECCVTDPGVFGWVGASKNLVLPADEDEELRASEQTSQPQGVLHWQIVESCPRSALPALVASPSSEIPDLRRQRLFLQG